MEARPAPAIIIAHRRSGGTFLAHCLSTHPQVYCDRGEPLHRHSPIMKAMWYMAGRRDAVEALRLVWGMEHYDVAMCKVNWGNLSEVVWTEIGRVNPRVIHLTRDNVLRSAVSEIVRQKAFRAGQRRRHTTRRLEPMVSDVDVPTLMELCRVLVAEAEDVRLKLGKQAWMGLTYVEMVGGEGAGATTIDRMSAGKLCDFLDVERRDLSCALVRVNPYPLHQIVRNWGAVKAAVGNSQHAHCLEDEAIWS